VPAAKTAQAVQNKNTARVTVTTQVRTDAQTIANNPSRGVGLELSNFTVGKRARKTE
jgi:hypothetical protein